MASASQQGSPYPPHNTSYPSANTGYPQNAGYPPATGYPQNAGYPPATGYPQNAGYPPNAGYQSNSGQAPNAGYPNAGYIPTTANPNTGYQTNTGHQQPVPNQPTPHMEEMGVGAEGDFAFSDKSIRNAFIRKVYGILTLQLAITFGIMAIMFFPPDVKQWVHDNPGFMWAAYGLSIAFFIVLVCVPNFRRKTPWNIIFLILFTICEGYLLGAICSFYDSKDVLKAVVTTIVLVVGLTLFAFQTKIDFTMLSGILFCCALGLLMFGFMAIIFQSEVLYSFYAALGAILFSVYIVVDTQLMIGGKHKLSISPEEYIFAALNLYLDIVNLFLFLLALFGRN